MGSPKRQIYCFDDVEIDIIRGTLSRNGEEVPMRAKTFQVLAYLLEHPSTPLTKDEIIKDVWKDTAVVDDVLVQSIKDIRRALGDDPQHPRFIRTIPKLGYRFIGDVTAEPTAVLNGGKPSLPDVETHVERKPDSTAIWNRRPVLAVVFVSVLAVLILVASSQTFREAAADVRLPQTPGKKPVVVMVFENSANSTELDWLREGLADMMIAGLSRSSNLSVLSRGQLQVLLERMGLGQSQKMGLDAALAVAIRSGAETVATGSFSRIGDKVRIDVELHDTKTGELTAVESLTVESPEQILTQIDLLSMNLVRRLVQADPDAGSAAAFSDVMTGNLEAYRYYSLGVEKANSLHNKEAIELLEKAIAIDPQFAMAHARIGYAYAVTWSFHEKGKPYLERAFQLSDRLTEKDRLNIAGWYSIANFDYPNAIEPFRQIIAKYPREIEAYYRAARLLQGEGQTEEAINIMRQGLAVDPEAKTLYNGLGGILSLLGRHDEAIAAHKRFVALSPNEPNAYDSLGATYEWAGQYALAIENFERALALKPDFEIAIIHLANTRFQLGQYRAAIALYERYIRNAKNDHELLRGYHALAAVYLRQRDLNAVARTEKDFSKIGKDGDVYHAFIAVERGDLGAVNKIDEQSFAKLHAIGRGGSNARRNEFYFRGYFALKNGRADEAVAHFQEAVRHLPQPWNPDAYEDCLANAYVELGRYDEAIAEYNRILALNPNYPMARFNLATALSKKGMVSEAKASYSQFLQDWKDADQDTPEVIAAKKFIAGSL